MLNAHCKTTVLKRVSVQSCHSTENVSDSDAGIGHSAADSRNDPDRLQRRLAASPSSARSYTWTWECNLSISSLLPPLPRVVLVVLVVLGALLVRRGRAGGETDGDWLAAALQARRQGEGRGAVGP